MDQVKFTDDTGQTYYGTVAFTKHLPESEQPAEGFVLVDDAILPKCYEVPEDVLTEIPFKLENYNHKTGDWEDLDEYNQYRQDSFKEANRKSETLGDEFKPGKLLQTPVGDGYAYYIVTKVNKKTVDVEWRGFCPDNWQDPVLGLGGRFPREQIETLVRRRDGLKKLFSRKTG